METTRIRDRLGELVRLAVANNRRYGMVACEKDDGSGLVVAPYGLDSGDPAVIVAKLGYTAALCRLEAGGQTMALVMEGGTKERIADDPETIARTAAAITAALDGGVLDPEVRETAVVIIVTPDAPTQLWMAILNRDDFGVVDLEWTDASTGGRTLVMAKMAEVLEVLAVNFPVAANVEAVAQIMGYTTSEVRYS